MSETLVGRRISDGSDIDDVVEPGDYLLLAQRDALWCMLPTGTINRIPVSEDGQESDPVKWGMLEHRDGTITLSPSINSHEIPGHSPGWHGFLERGVWRSV